MPYFDMLQFYESLSEQVQTSKKIENIYAQVSKILPKLEAPLKLKLSA
jgi:hypothetical protein